MKQKDTPKQIGAPKKTDGTKKVQVTISVQERHIEKLGKEKVKSVSIDAVEKEYKKNK